MHTMIKLDSSDSGFSSEAQKNKSSKEKTKTKQTRSEFEHGNGKRKKITFCSEQVVVQIIRVFIMYAYVVSLERETSFISDFGLPKATKPVNI